MPKWYPWFARMVFLIFCIMGGWALYISLTKRQIDLSILEGKDILAIIGLSFGFYSTAQIILRYVAIPAPRIMLENSRPTRLGPEEALPIPNNAMEKDKREIEQINWKRQFAIHKVQVWNHDIHWLIRPLMQKVTAEGCIVRFRYALLKDGQEVPALNSEWLYGRWDDNMEPVSPAGFDLRIATINRRLAKLFPTEKVGNLDAYPFRVAFSMKKEGEENFYHFNDESYGWGAGWCNPHWILGQGTYHVEVRLTGYGLLRATTAKFRIINRGPRFVDWILDDC